MSNFSEKIQRIEKELFKILSNSTQAIYDLVLKYNDLRRLRRKRKRMTE